MGWLARLLGRRRLERELDRELAFHVEEHARRLTDAGVPPAEARRQARLALGGVEQVKEDVRDTRGTRWLEDWVADVRYALRTLWRAPGFAAAAVLTLAIGLGANAAVFRVVDALLVRSLPVARPDQLHILRRAGIDDGTNGHRLSAAEYSAFGAALGDSSALAAFTPPFRLYATVADLPEPATGQLITGGWFPLLGVTPAAGRLLGAADARGEAAAPVAVISHGYWSRRFGRDPGVIGSTLRVNGFLVEIVGVAEPGFFGISVGDAPDLWLPAGLQQAIHYLGNASAEDADFLLPWLPQPGIRWLWAVARVPDAAALSVVRERLGRSFEQQREPRLARADSATRAFLLREHVVLESAVRGVSDARTRLADPLVALMASVGLVLLVACGNLASLLIARGAARSREVAVRVALGAGRGRLVRQVLTESIVLALLGGAAGLVVAWAGSHALLRAASLGTDAMPVDLSVDGRLLGFVALLAVGTGLLFGMAPAWRIARTGPFGEFRSAGRVVGRARADRLPMGRLLVTGQVALSLVLVTVSALLARTFGNLNAIDPGFARHQVVAARIDPRAAGYDADQIPAFNERVRAAIAAVPGVSAVSMATYTIGSGSSRSSSFEVPGVVRPAEEDPDAQVLEVSRDFFATVGIPILAGRAFTAADAAGPAGQTVAVVSRSAARFYFGTEDVIGRRFGNDATDPRFEIIGVVPDVYANSLADDPPRMVYLSADQAPATVLSSIEARVDRPAAAIAPAIRTAIAGVDPSLPVREVVPVDDLLGRQLAQRRMAAQAARLFGVLALLLAAIGLYGVMAYSVARRTNELGIRIALGAGAAGVRWLVLRDTLGVVAAGVTVGALLTWPAVELVRSQLYGVSPRDPASIALAVAVMAATGVAAGLLPAWRASRVEPAEALRAE